MWGRLSKGKGRRVECDVLRWGLGITKMLRGAGEFLSLFQSQALDIQSSSRPMCQNCAKIDEYQPHRSCRFVVLPSTHLNRPKRTYPGKKPRIWSERWCS